jgi:uncharacterized coiled-coil protein SlyX
MLFEPDDHQRRLVELEAMAARMEVEIEQAAKAIDESRRQLAEFREHLREMLTGNEFRFRLRLDDVVEEPGPPTFSLKWMLIVVCFVALAMKLQMEFDSALVCFICGATVGAAVFSLARRPLFGVVVGVGAQVLILIVLNVFFHIRIR